MQKSSSFTVTSPNSACLASSKYYIMYTRLEQCGRTLLPFFYVPDMARNLPDGTDTSGRGKRAELKQ